MAGKYLLDDCLGVGGMGEVYRATNVSLGRKVAIKLLSAEYVHIEDDVLRFLREARAAAAIRHANVVDVIDVARDDDGTPFIVQELLTGEDLERYLRTRGGRISCEEGLEIMIPVADAVAAAHAQNVVHRDLKPANVFLARERNTIVPKVLDFGACLFPTMAERSTREVRTLIGTPHYMAPEQIARTSKVDARSDVWALGVMLYEMIVGETPFEAATASAVMQLVKTRDVPSLRQRAKDVPATLDALIVSCTRRDPSARPPDAGAVHEAMLQIRAALRGSLSSRMPTIAEAPPPDIASEPPAAPLPPPPALARSGSASEHVRLLSLDSPASIPSPASMSLRDDVFDADLAPGPALDLAATPSSWPPRNKAATSSLPPVLDPRRAAPAPHRAVEEPAAAPTPPPRHVRPTAVSAPKVADRTHPWSTSDVAKLGAAVALPAAAVSAVVLGVPALAAPIARALRGDSPFASGALAIVSLVTAAVLCGQSLLGRRSVWLYIAAGAAVLFSITMIIVTFAASEAAELGVPASMSGVSALLGPVAPLALGLEWLGRARATWLDREGRAESVRFTALTASMVVLAVVLSPVGAVRASPRPPAPTSSVGS